MAEKIKKQTLDGQLAEKMLGELMPAAKPEPKKKGANARTAAGDEAAKTYPARTDVLGGEDKRATDLLAPIPEVLRRKGDVAPGVNAKRDRNGVMDGVNMDEEVLRAAMFHAREQTARALDDYRVVLPTAFWPWLMEGINAMARGHALYWTPDGNVDLEIVKTEKKRGGV